MTRTVAAFLAEDHTEAELREMLTDVRDARAALYRAQEKLRSEEVVILMRLKRIRGDG